ncbi:MAG: winged helix-turn-helix domain-containing protein [Gammaproteobacteria bacterium]|nr:winged helix-turn-helix domain-containing protein [Gammaproteobacteria bacterium]
MFLPSVETKTNVGDCLIQSDDRCVIHLSSGKQARLEPKVIYCFCFLAEHAGEVVSRKQLREAIWANVYGSDQAINRVISQIRCCLKEIGASRVGIETVPGFGYRLIVHQDAKIALQEDLSKPVIKNRNRNSKFWNTKLHLCIESVLLGLIVFLLIDK